MGTTTVRKHEIRLTDEQRARFTDLIRNGSAPAKKIAHARVLLLADRDHPDGRRPDEYIAEILGLHVNTVKRIRWRFVGEGEAPALDRKPRLTPPVPPKIDGRVEAHLVALCCSPAPEGYVRWTLSLLAGELSRRGLVTSVCVETVRRALKKTNCSPGGRSAGVSRSGTPLVSLPRWRKSSTCTRPNTRQTNR
jgi:Homeodomain-like domain